MQVAGVETNDFADAPAGVEQQTQQDQIPASAGRRAVDSTQNCLDFVGFQRLNGAADCALEGQAQYALSLFEVLGVLRTQVAKEAVNGAQPDVAGSRQTPALGLKVLEKSQDTLGGDRLDLKPTRVAVRSGQELQQELEAVAIAAQRVGAQGPLLGQKVGEKTAQGAAQHGRGAWFHSAPPGLSR